MIVSYPQKEKIMAKMNYEIEHSGYGYDVKEIVDIMQQHNLKLPEAIRMVHPSTPDASMNALATKMRKTPYFQAYKKAKTEILTAAGPMLQANMLDLAFAAKSEMVRFSATDAAMKRVYGDSQEAEAKSKPPMVFNFSFGTSQTAPAVADTSVVIDGDQA